MILRPIELEDFRPLKTAAQAEGAECVAPTHVLVDENRIVGYGGAGKLMVISGWTSEAVDDETSLAALRRMETVAREAGAEWLVVCCTDDCRFKPFMEAEGYTTGAKTVTTYLKKAN